MNDAAALHYESLAGLLTQQGFSSVVGGVSSWVTAQLGTPSETSSARRDRIRRSSGANAADALFDAGDFSRAAAVYQAAFDAERDSLRDGAEVSMMYNAALSLLGAREYERALEAASTAHALGSNRSVRDLIVELRQRLADRETFASISVAPPE